MDLNSIGVTAQKEKQFMTRGIDSVEALAAYLPNKYKDFSRITGLIQPPGISCLVVHVDRMQRYFGGKTPMFMLFCTCTQTGAKIHVQFFNQMWMSNRLANCVNKDVYVAGKATYNEQYNNYTITSPDIFEPDIQKAMRIYPVYRKVTGMSNDYLTEKIKTALQFPAATDEICPPDIIKRCGQVSRKEALMALHFPRTVEDVRVGQKRILFDDLLYFALHNTLAERMSAKGSPFNIRTLKSYNAICGSLPYTLTKDQADAIDGMIAHIRSGLRLNALLQGDVGCGKSIVAFIMMAVMADSGYQSIIMAPTQVLARQHYDDLTALLEPLGRTVVFLGGSEMKAAEKKKVLSSIKSGQADIIVGTHAVISKGIEYARLGLVIADEEHRFGVAQRAALIDKAQDGVHSITMSATPIPRSLAQVVYGDTIQLYTIKTMPVGRLPVMTGIAKGRDRIYRFIIAQKNKGMQTYVVCPMIDKNESMEGVKSVEETAAEYEAALAPYGVSLATLTGRNSKAETEETIAAFRKGDIDVLIATTVIEVGVNVPRASTIVITNAERFGLSTLHQLRGRVGRGQWQSYCVLESNGQTDTGRQRLEVMCSTTSGFKIAEEDLKIRGAGDFLGTQQSGDNKYMSLMLAYPDVYQCCKSVAAELLDRGEDCCPLVKRVVREKVASTYSSM